MARAEQGEEVVITRHGKPVVKLQPVANAETQRERARAALARMKARAAKLHVSSSEAIEFMREGRR